jgi:hypothetical protein
MIIALGFVNTQPSVTSKPGVWPRGSRYIRPSRQDSLIDSAYVMLYQVYNSSFDVLLFTWELQYGKILEVSMMLERQAPGHVTTLMQDTLSDIISL